MPKRSSKGHRDLNKLGASIVAQATADAPPPTDDGKNPAAVALGRLGGLKGGRARANALSQAKRVAIAKQAAETRWGKTRTQPAAEPSVAPGKKPRRVIRADHED